MSYAIVRVDPTQRNVVRFLDFLQTKNTHALGFLPWQAMEEAIARGVVLQAFENGSPCGYMIHGKIRQNTRIIQTVVADDARRIQHATAMVDALTLLCNHAQAHEITLHCAEDLESNAFWQALGFTATGRRLKNSKGTRWQIRYQKELPGRKIADMIKTRKIKAAGLENLQRLLVKGDARIGSVDLTRHRSTKHELQIEHHNETPTHPTG